MRYISTRNNHQPLPPSQTIAMGMVPQGGLFVPESIPQLNPADVDGSYQHTAQQVLAPFLTDFSEQELLDSVNGAYTDRAFDIPGIVDLRLLDNSRSILELWHGPTAAFKDMALQIMPFFMRYAKKKAGDRTHTVILVATSGDTGKAALEGFKDQEGVTIIVFFPANGVSEIQKRQMITTEGRNTHVVAVKGNFDDCQSGVKIVFGDASLASQLSAVGMELSSANSINWGRLCPQITYYYRAYNLAVSQKFITAGDPVNFCVPTGNFGNLLACYYARQMGLPVRRLICASNKNRVLADFFASGIYDRRREFYQTSSPSMDILISSNLERFLFEITGRDASRVQTWFSDLMEKGTFTVDDQTRAAMASLVRADWADDKRANWTIKSIFDHNGYVLDTHTAVAVTVEQNLHEDGTHTIIDSTASPYKFSTEVLAALTGKKADNEFDSIDQIQALTGSPVHRALADLKEKPIRHRKVITVDQINETVVDLCKSIRR